MKGFDFMTDRVKFNIETKKKWYNYIDDFIDTFMDRITPLKNEVKVIRGSQNTGI
jgi:hypothetical protein